MPDRTGIFLGWSANLSNFLGLGVEAGASPMYPKKMRVPPLGLDLPHPQMATLCTVFWMNSFTLIFEASGHILTCNQYIYEMAMATAHTIPMKIYVKTKVDRFLFSWQLRQPITRAGA